MITKEIREKIKAIIEKLDEIDAKISEYSESWKIERLGKVELSILRLAAYEIMFDDDIPANIAINEAVELAKKYGADESSGFVNAILGKVAKA